MQTVLTDLIFGQARMLRGVENALAADPNLALVGRFQKIQAAKKRRFASAGGADNRQNLALFHRKIDAAQNVRLAEGLLYVFCFQCFHDRHTLK